MVERGWVPEKAVHTLLAAELMIQQVSLDEIPVDMAVAALIPASLCQRHLVLPIAIQDKRLTAAMADPLDEGLLHDLRFITGLEIAPVLATMSAITAKIGQVYGSALAGLSEADNDPNASDPYEGVEIVIEDDDTVQTVEELLHGTDEPPAIRLVNAILLEAIQLGASDIHI